jgi:pyruvate carboxylase
LDDRQLASYLMYPKVTREYFEHARRYGDTSVLPTPAFLYGLRPTDELAVDIDPGKTLLVSLQSIAADVEDGVFKVQFELNGQPRTLRAEKRELRGKRPARPQADPANPLHVAAPMPGGVVAVSVKPGQHVQAGNPLVWLEAMKMETHILADRDGVVEQVLVNPGDQVLAKDLLVVLKSQG